MYSINWISSFGLQHLIVIGRVLRSSATQGRLCSRVKTSSALDVGGRETRRSWKRIKANAARGYSAGVESASVELRVQCAMVTKDEKDSTVPDPDKIPEVQEKTKTMDVVADDDLSEEDRQLKEKLELLVSRIKDPELGVQKMALETIRSEIRSATSSMTSVPKPLKFLRPHFESLKAYYASAMREGDNKVFMADILSVLAMTMGNEMQCESLRFKLRGSKEPPHLWGHEYVRHLAGEIAREYLDITDDDDPESQMKDVTDLATRTVPDPTAPSSAAMDDSSDQPPPLKLERATLKEINAVVADIVPFLMSSNAEPEAVDLLMEVDSLSQLTSLTDEHNYARVCLYLKSCADYVPEKEDTDELLKVAAEVYSKVDKRPEAMQVAIRRGDIDLITTIYKETEAGSRERIQLAFDLGRAGILLDESVEEDHELRQAMSNRKLTEQFLHLARDLDVIEPKKPEDIYKTHLIDSRAGSSTATVDSARANLASTFVNAFVNMGFGNDTLMTPEDSRWIYRNTDHGMMSAAASLGMITLWDVDGGLDGIDKYMYAEQDFVKAGALLAVGIVSASVRHEVDPALALLAEQVSSDVAAIRNGAIAGLGIAYAATNKDDVRNVLVPVLMDVDTSADTAALAALSLGLVFIGSGDEDISMSLFQVLSDRKDTPEVNSEAMVPIFMPLALGLLFLGRQKAAEVVNETIEAMVGTDSLLGRITSITLQACAYCGTGSVTKVQKFLSICGDHPTTAEASEVSDTAATPSDTPAPATANGGSVPNNASAAPTSGATGVDAADGDNMAKDAERVRIAKAEQSVAVLGLAMVAMGEELGAEMCMRAFGHLLQYGDAGIRRVVPLALGLMSISNPKLELMDLLSKFTHDSDMEVAQSAIVALGFIGAGTNNSRIAGMLRQLSVYYSKEPSSLFLVRISQGLLHSGKGLVTLNPFYGDNKFLQNKPAMGGILTVLFACLDMKGTILGKNHYLLFFLSLASRPRMVFTVNESMEFLATTVRVGQAVDTVGQAGRPKSITGFQTHTTPVLLAAGERAEIATEEFLSVGAAVEGVVVLRKNPEWVDESGLENAVAAMETVKATAVSPVAASSSAGAGPSSAAGPSTS